MSNCAFVVELLLGVRTFQSHSAANSFQYIGGPAVVLSFVAMASDDSSLYAAVKVLLSVLSTSPGMEREMNRIQGYKVSERWPLRRVSGTCPSLSVSFTPQ